MASPPRCPHCGRDNDPSFAFCLGCGRSLRAQEPGRTCTGCGAWLAAGSRFCGRCGRAAPAAAPGPERPPAGAVAWRAPAAAPAAVPRPTAPQAPFPSPAAAAVHGPPRALRLVLARPDGRPATVFPLAAEVNLCGRGAGEVPLEDPAVSPRHAAFSVREGRVWLEDLESASGTFVRLRTSRALAPGEEVRVGRQTLRLEPMPRGEGDGATVWGWRDPGYRFRLVQLLEGGGEGEVFPLRPGPNLLGREVGEISFPGDRYVSARHASLVAADRSVALADLGSSNGTFVRIAGPVELLPGDQVLLGAQLLRLDA